jgi:hypothetical protein
MLSVIYLHPHQFQTLIMKASVIYKHIFTNMAMVKKLWPVEIIHRTWSISNIIINV